MKVVLIDPYHERVAFAHVTDLVTFCKTRIKQPRPAYSEPSRVRTMSSGWKPRPNPSGVCSAIRRAPDADAVARHQAAT
jgi:hypothetical protein